VQYRPREVRIVQLLAGCIQGARHKCSRVFACMMHTPEHVCVVTVTIKVTANVSTSLRCLKLWSRYRNVTFTFCPFCYLHQTINLRSNSSTPCSWQLCAVGWRTVRRQKIPCWYGTAHSVLMCPVHGELSDTFAWPPATAVYLLRNVAEGRVGAIAVCAARGRYKTLVTSAA